MLNSKQKVQECDTTGDDNSNAVGHITKKIFFLINCLNKKNKAPV